MPNRAQTAANTLDSMQGNLMPASVPAAGQAPTVGELLQAHPQYRADLIEQYQTWYDGGHRFKEALDEDEDGTYLVLRRADKEKLDERYTYRKLRKARAQFSSEIGRIIASMQATILRNPPQLKDDDQYVRKLNSDADGAGTEIAEVARQILECGLLHARAYLGPTFPGIDTAGMDMEQATKAGALDGKLRFYHARNVPWWSYAPDGRLQAVRIYTYGDQFSRGTWGALTSRTHQWVIIDDTTIKSYSYVQPATNGRLKPIDKTKQATSGPEQSHGFDRCPIKEFQFGKSFWVADRLVDPQKRLFNSEADEAFIRSECAHPQRVLNGLPQTDTNADGRPVVKASPVHGIHFPDGNGKYELIGPDAAQNAWHSTAIERDRQNLYSALESLYLGLANQAQNARQAASAKAMDASQSTLFMAFAAAQLESQIAAVIGAIKEKRGSASTLTMEGLNRIDGRGLEQMIAEAKAFFELNPPETAKRYVMESITTRIMAGADEEETQKAIKEIDVSPPADPAGAPNPGMPKTEEGDTKEGKSMEEDHVNAERSTRR